MIDPIRLRPYQLDEPLEIVTKVGGDTEATRPFSDVLKDSMMTVNDLQVRSDKLVQKLALGEVEDVSEVSIAVEKAELALRMMTTIRDKLVDAYNQISRMQ